MRLVIWCLIWILMAAPLTAQSNPLTRPHVGSGWETLVIDTLSAESASARHEVVIPVSLNARLPPITGAPTRYIEVRMDNEQPLRGDLDLEVFTSRPGGDGGVRPACESNDTGSVDACYFSGSPDSIWIRVKLFNEVGESGYRVAVRRLAGPLINEFFADDATAIPVTSSRSFTMPHSERESETVGAGGFLFRVDTRPGEAAELTLSGAIVGQGLGLEIYSAEGDLIDEAPDEEGQDPVRVILDGGGVYFATLALVHPERLTAPDSLYGTAYEVAAAEPDDATVVSISGQGFFTSENRDESKYRFTIPEDSIVAVVVHGRGSVLSVTRSDDSPPIDTSRHDLPAFGLSIVLIGQRSDDRGITMIRGAQQSAEVRVNVSRSRDLAYSAGRRDVRIRSVGSRFRNLLIPDVIDMTDAAAELPGNTAATFSGAGRIRIMRLAPPVTTGRASTGLPRHRARLIERASDWDLVVTTELGQVIDIGADAVAWAWPETAEALYLVAIQTGPDGSQPAVVRYSR